MPKLSDKIITYINLQNKQLLIIMYINKFVKIIKKLNDVSHQYS